MIHVLYKLPKEYDIILDGLEKYLTSSGPPSSQHEGLHSHSLTHHLLSYGMVNNL